MDTPTEALSQACRLIGGVRAMADSLGVTPSAVGQWINGKRPIPAERCPSIERATGGKVRAEQLRPDVDWGALRHEAGVSS